MGKTGIEALTVYTHNLYTFQQLWDLWPYLIVHKAPHIQTVCNTCKHSSSLSFACETRMELLLIMCSHD